MEISNEVKNAIDKASRDAARAQKFKEAEQKIINFIHETGEQNGLDAYDLLNMFVGFVASAIYAISKSDVTCVDNLGKFMERTCNAINTISNGKVDIRLEKRREE